MKQILVLSFFIALFSCNSSDIASQDIAATQPNQVGKGGSTTKFAIIGNYLYVVEKSYLKTFDLTTPSEPKLIDNLFIPDELETIFPFKYEGDDVLLLGANNGMHVYIIDNDGLPNNESNVVLAHQNSCDPVVASQLGYAYVTLRSSVSFGCSQGFNELHINNISNLQDIKKEGSIKMVGPKGLSLSADELALLVCDKYDLKIYSLADPIAPNYEGSKNLICNDILQYKDNYIVTGDNVLKIYSFDAMNYEFNFEYNLLSQSE